MRTSRVKILQRKEAWRREPNKKVSSLKHLPTHKQWPKGRTTARSGGVENKNWSAGPSKDKGPWATPQSYFNNNKKDEIKKGNTRSAWVAQSVEQPTSAQVMISQLVSSSPASGSVLTAQSLEPASDSVSPSLSAPPLRVLYFSQSLKNK